MANQQEIEETDQVRRFHAGSTLMEVDIGGEFNAGYPPGAR